MYICYFIKKDHTTVDKSRNCFTRNTQGDIAFDTIYTRSLSSSKCYIPVDWYIASYQEDPLSDVMYVESDKEDEDKHGYHEPELSRPPL